MPPLTERFDIAVIGGGPAGAAAAIRAARGGARVIVFEKGTFGRDKVCGDGLTPRAVGALEDLDIDLAGRPPHRRSADDRRHASGGSCRGRPPGGSRPTVPSGRAAGSTPISSTPPTRPGPSWCTRPRRCPVLDGDRVIGVETVAAPTARPAHRGRLTVDRRRRAGQGRPHARRRARPRRAVRPRHPRLRRVAPPRSTATSRRA